MRHKWRLITSAFVHSTYSSFAESVAFTFYMFVHKYFSERVRDKIEEDRVTLP